MYVAAQLVTKTAASMLAVSETAAVDTQMATWLFMCFNLQFQIEISNLSDIES